MPWTGPNFIRENGPSPIFTGDSVWQSDAAAAILIESSRHDFHDFDLAQGIDACLNKNGANSPTANINWGLFKITQLGYGSGFNDAAAYGQVPISASLNSSTNVLTLTKADTTTFTVDLTPLVVGGSTADFAKLSASDNSFVGQAEFGGQLTATNNLILNRTGSTTDNWTWNTNSPFLLTLRPSVGGMQFNFQRDVGDPNGGYMMVNGYKVWNEFTLTPATVAGILTVSSNPSLTGSWNFSAGSIIVPSTLTWAATGGAWNTTVNSASWQLFSGATGDVFKLDHDATEGMRGFVNGHRLWTNATLKTSSTAIPTGGTANDLAVVPTGANRGLWQNLAGTWTKLIAFP